MFKSLSSSDSNWIEVYQIKGNQRCFSCAKWTRINIFVDKKLSQTPYKKLCKDCGEESLGALFSHPQSDTIKITMFQNCLHCGDFAEVKASFEMLEKRKTLSTEKHLLSEKLIKLYCKCGMYLANIHVKWFEMTEQERKNEIGRN